MERRIGNKQSSDEEIKGPTTNLVMINLIFYLLTTIWGGNLIFTGDLPIIFLGISLQTLKYGFFWTPITSIFVHSGIPHLAGNMIYLLVFGFRLEERNYEDKVVYAGYIIPGILAGLLALTIMPATSFSVGASGAIFGLLGLNAGIEKRNKDPNFTRLIGAVIILFIMSSGPRTNIFAHLFGLIIGFILGLTDYINDLKLEN